LVSFLFRSGAKLYDNFEMGKNPSIINLKFDLNFIIGVYKLPNVNSYFWTLYFYEFDTSTFINFNFAKKL